MNKETIKEIIMLCKSIILFIFSFIILIAFLTWINENNKVIDTSYLDTETEIVYANYYEEYTTHSITSVIHHNARYIICIKYNGEKYYIDNEKLYNKYKNKIGETVTAKFEIRTYRSGSTKKVLIELG